MAGIRLHRHGPWGAGRSRRPAGCRRGRLELSLPVQDWLAEAAALPEVPFEPVTHALAALAGHVGDDLPGDPGDRPIAATALHMALPLVTADAKLQAMPGLKTVW